jgi:hypothetical protein
MLARTTARIADAGGMAQLAVADKNGGGATRPTPDHIGYRMEAC